MKRLDRDAWRRREEAFAAFRAWEDGFRRREGPEDREHAVRFALEAADLWRACLPSDLREPRADLEKVRGISRMREILARVRFTG